MKESHSVVYLNKLLPMFIRMLCIMIISVVFHCALLWLICLKRIRNIYNINTRVAVLTVSVPLFLILIHNLVIDKNADTITQTESNSQVVIRYDREQNEIFLIQFPFSFEYKNHSLKNRNVNFGYIYKSNFEGNYSNGRTRLFYKINDELVEDYNLRKEAKLANIFKSNQFTVQTFHFINSIDTTKAIQVYFQPYIEQMKVSDSDSLSIGTMQEFVQRHPQLTEIFLKGDSIGFGVDERLFVKEKVWNRVTLPIRY